MPIVLESGSLNLLEPSGTVQARSFTFYLFTDSRRRVRKKKIERKKECDENCGQNIFQLLHKHSDSVGVSFYEKKAN